MVLIAPSILSADFSHLGEEIKAVEEAGADWIHIDVMDGHFVPNITIGPPVISKIRAISNIFFDVHLMISSPEDYIPQFAKSGANLITFHIETCQDPHRCISKIREHECKVGVCLNPETHLNSITDCIELVDLVLVMSVHPGFGGQTFIPETTAKIKQVRKYIDSIEKHIFLEVDGGINDRIAKTVVKNGADVLVAGNYVFMSDNYRNAIQSLKM
jgi:ribulose-phosphate 3-epimerase